VINLLSYRSLIRIADFLVHSWFRVVLPSQCQLVSESLHVLHLVRQGVVTCIPPVEVFATSIKNLDQQRLSICIPAELDHAIISGVKNQGVVTC